MNITGYTPQEAYALCQDAGLNIPLKTILSAFDSAGKPGGYTPRLDVLKPSERMRLCTMESFTRWLAYHQERHDVETGVKEPKDCTLINYRTALRLRNKFLKHSSPEKHYK